MRLRIVPGRRVTATVPVTLRSGLMPGTIDVIIGDIVHVVSTTFVADKVAFSSFIRDKSRYADESCF